MGMTYKKYKDTGRPGVPTAGEGLATCAALRRNLPKPHASSHALRPAPNARFDFILVPTDLSGFGATGAAVAAAVSYATGTAPYDLR